MQDVPQSQGDYSPLQGFSPTAREIILTLKREGGGVVDGLSAATHVTPSAVRQQIAILVSEGLVAFEQFGHGPGRRKRLYSLTERGQRLFPNRYDETIMGLAGYAEEHAPELLDGYFREVADRRLERHGQRLGALEPGARAEQLPEIFADDRYLADTETNGTGPTRFVLHHCPLLRLATEHPLICQVERDFLQDLFPERFVRRVDHRPAGDLACVYVIAERDLEIEDAN